MKLRVMPPEAQNDRLTKCLKYVFRLIGLKKLPDEKDTLVLKEFILTEWKHVTIEEIVLAFRLYAKQELDDCPQSFQNFNTVFFSRIMQSFIRYKSSKFAMNKPAKQLPEKRELTDDDKLAILEDYFKACLFESFENEESIFSAAFMFKKLESLGLIKLTSREKDVILKRAQEVFAHRLKNPNSLHKSKENAKRIKSILSGGLSTGDEKKIKEIAREIALKQWLDEKKKSKTTVQELRHEVLTALHLSFGRSYHSERGDDKAGTGANDGTGTQKAEEGRGADH